MDERDSIKKNVASKGKVLRRTSDGFLAGPDLYLGYTYYLHGEKLDEPLLELPEHYEEIDIPEELKDNDINTD